MRSILDKVGFIPVPYAAGACLLIVAIMAGCTSDSYGGDCHANGALQFNGGCHVRQQARAEYQPAVVLGFAVPVYAQPQQFNGHHAADFRQQAKFKQQARFQPFKNQQVVRQRIVTRSR